MKKNLIYSTIIMVATTLMAVSCQKDQSTNNFGARLEQVNSSKVSIEDIDANNSYPRFFSQSENIRINGGTYTIQYSGDEAQINGVTSDEGTTRKYTAFYPASLVGDANVRDGQITVTLPAVQNYVEVGGKQDVALPMAAVIEGSGNIFNFYNLCSLLKVKVHNGTSAAFTVRAIQVAASASNICGTATVTPTGSANDFLTVTNGQKSVTLAGINKSVAANSDAYFYVILPKISTNNTFSFRIYTNSGRRVLQMTGSGVQLPRNTIADIQLNVNTITPEGFSTTSTRQVDIAPGNLQYQGSTGSYRFAPNEWEVIGNAVGNTTAQNDGRATQSAWIDLMSWGTSGATLRYLGTNYTLNPDYLYGYDTHFPSDDINGSNYDWGQRNAIGDDPANTWRTPTKPEWDYLFNTRTMLSYSGGTVPRYRFCTLAGVNGMLIFPDNFQPMTSDEISLMNASAITAAQWPTLKELGCAFLPVTGIRSVGGSGTRHTATVEETNVGHYWSSSRSTLGLGTQASSVWFGTGWHDITNYGSNYGLDAADGTQQHKGCAVRLVKTRQ